MIKATKISSKSFSLNPIPKYREGFVTKIYSFFELGWDKFIDLTKFSLNNTKEKSLEFTKIVKKDLRFIINHLLRHLTSMEGLSFEGVEIRIAVNPKANSKEQIIGLILEGLKDANYFIGLEQIGKISKESLISSRIGLLETKSVFPENLDCDLQEIEKKRAIDLLHKLAEYLKKGLRLPNLPWKMALEKFWFLEWMNLVEAFFALLIITLTSNLIFKNIDSRLSNRDYPLWFLNGNLAEFLLLFLASIFILHLLSRRHEQDYRLDIQSLEPEYTKKEYNIAKKRLDKEFDPYLKTGFWKKLIYFLDNLLAYFPPITFFHILLSETDIFALRATVIKNFDSYCDLLQTALIGKLAKKDDTLKNSEIEKAKKIEEDSGFTSGQDLDSKFLLKFSPSHGDNWLQAEVDLRGSTGGASTYQISWAVDYIARSRIWADFFEDSRILVYRPENKGDNILFPNLRMSHITVMKSLNKFYKWLIDDFLAVQDRLSISMSLPKEKDENENIILRPSIDFRLKIMYAGNHLNDQPNPLGKPSSEGSIPAIAGVHLGLKVGHKAKGRNLIIDAMTAALILGYQGYKDITGGLILDRLQESLAYQDLQKNWIWTAYYVPLPEKAQRLRAENDVNEEGRLHFLLSRKE